MSSPISDINSSPKQLDLLENEVNIMKNEIKELKEAQEKSNSRFLLSKLIIAIREINRLDDLQNSKTFSYMYFTPLMVNLSRYRHAESHFISTNPRTDRYRKSIEHYGRKQLCERLQLAKNDRFIMSVLERYSPTLVDDLIQYLTKTTELHVPDPPTSEKENKDMWWEMY
jgi:hypothetical protein